MYLAKRMKEYDLQTPHKVLVEKIKSDFSGIGLIVDKKLKLYGEYVAWLEAGLKGTTVRFRRNKIRYPAGNILPLIETNPDNKKYECPSGNVLLHKMIVKRFGELDNSDAKNDGFIKKEDLVGALQKIYGHISENELVTIYHIKKLS